MLLKVMDRLVLMQILPMQGDVLQAKIVGDLRAKLGIPEPEQQRIGMKTDEAGRLLGWDAEKDLGKEFKFGPRALVIIKDALKGLSDTKQLGPPHVSLWEKFVGPIALEADEEITVSDPEVQ